MSTTNDSLSAIDPDGLQHAPQLTQSALVRVYVLSLMGVISLIGNVAIIFHFFKTRKLRRTAQKTWSTIYILILHLTIADLFVTVFCIFGEAAWSYTVEWIAGELACKLVKFSQMFALYLSTYVLVLIGIDRWTAVKYPMQSLHMSNRCHRYLIIVYILSIVLSSPQVKIFTAISNIPVRSAKVMTLFSLLSHSTTYSRWRVDHLSSHSISALPTEHIRPIGKKNCMQCSR